MTKIKVELENDEHGKVSTIVETEHNNDFHLHFEEIVTEARKNAASRFVSYEAFKSDDDYLTALETLGENFKIVEFLTVDDGKPKVRWSIYGRYSDDERGTWSDWVEASTAEEADFVARQTMADNEGVDANDVSDYAITMDEIQIEECGLEPVTLDELAATVREIIALVNGGCKLDGSETLEKAKQQIAAIANA